jgi:hypothetical protein
MKQIIKNDIGDFFFYEYDTSKKEESCHLCNNGKLGDILNVVETREAGKIGLCRFCFGFIVDQDLEAMLRGMREEAEIEIKKINKIREVKK